MIQKDYIMRMIEQLSRCLAKILFNKNAGEHEAAMATVETAFRTILGIDSRLLDVLSARDIGELFGISKDPSTGGMRCIIAARLLKETAEIQEHEGVDDTSVVPTYVKSLSLYLDGILSMGYTELDVTGYCSEAGHIVDWLGNSLPSDLRLKVDTMNSLLEASDNAENRT